MSKKSFSFAPENVALNKTAYQSSDYEENGEILYAGLAVDGNTNSEFFAQPKTCIHVYRNDPWWAVDLAQTYYIRLVRIFNRGDCCGKFILNFVATFGRF